MTEIWKSAEGYEGALEVSSFGRIKALAFEKTGMRNGFQTMFRRADRILTPSVGGGRRYLQVAPYTNGVRKKVYVHRLVAKAFVPGYFEGATVNHIDGDKMNNTPPNLEWVTLADNTRHQWATGLLNARGEAHTSHKLSSEAVVDVLTRRETARTAARRYGVSESLIYNIRKGTSRRQG